MARLRFSNVPTSTGGVVSGDISTGSGSPFGSGGQYEAQVADIQATIAKAPEGTYDPKFWDQFLEIDPDEFPEDTLGMFIPSDDPEIIRDLYDIPTARMAMQRLANMPTYNPRWSQDQRVELEKEKKEYESIIAINVNNLMMEKNAPLIKAVEGQQLQLEIDKGVRLQLEQIEIKKKLRRN